VGNVLKVIVRTYRALKRRKLLAMVGRLKGGPLESDGTPVAAAHASASVSSSSGMTCCRRL
jgi:hypothetical protein